VYLTALSGAFCVLELPGLTTSTVGPKLWLEAGAAQRRRKHQGAGAVPGKPGTDGRRGADGQVHVAMTIFGRRCGRYGAALA